MFKSRLVEKSYFILLNLILTVLKNIHSGYTLAVLDEIMEFIFFKAIRSGKISYLLT